MKRKNKYLHLLKIFGLMSILSYTLAFLGKWIWLTWTNNYVYFQVGEPDLVTKYIEWSIGIIGIFALISVIKREIKKFAVRAHT